MYENFQNYNGYSVYFFFIKILHANGSNEEVKTKRLSLFNSCILPAEHFYLDRFGAAEQSCISSGATLVLGPTISTLTNQLPCDCCPNTAWCCLYSRVQGYCAAFVSSDKNLFCCMSVVLCIANSKGDFFYNLLPSWGTCSSPTPPSCFPSTLYLFSPLCFTNYRM